MTPSSTRGRPGHRQHGHLAEDPRPGAGPLRLHAGGLLPVLPPQLLPHPPRAEAIVIRYVETPKTPARELGWLQRLVILGQEAAAAPADPGKDRGRDRVQLTEGAAVEKMAFRMKLRPRRRGRVQAPPRRDLAGDGGDAPRGGNLGLHDLSRPRDRRAVCSAKVPRCRGHGFVRRQRHRSGAGTSTWPTCSRPTPTSRRW